jgi:hypothetical protein
METVFTVALGAVIVVAAVLLLALVLLGAFE